MNRTRKEQLFDEWPEIYDGWFSTPIGALVKRYESELILDLLKPDHGDFILDAGCGTGIFTLDILSAGSRVVGLDLSSPMLMGAMKRGRGYPFCILSGDILSLPFPEGVFDKVVSITALEFIDDGKTAVSELFRVTKAGGAVMVASLNSLSSWAARRRRAGKKGHRLFERAIFRSPDELRSLAPVEGMVRTAIHFEKEGDPKMAPAIEREGREQGLSTGAFVAALWRKQE